MDTTRNRPARGRTRVSGIRLGAIALGLMVAASSPAAAQWTRIDDLPASDVIAVSANRDTIVAGTRTLAYVSTDAGVSWQPSTKPGTGVPILQAVLLRNGKLFTGTAGQGVFVSDDRGQTWSAFNQGLVGGLFNTQLDVSDLKARGDSLYASTYGAGVYVRNLAAAGTWHHFGEEFEPSQASNVRSLAVGGTRLLAAAGGNGSVFFRDPGDGDWTVSWLDNVGLRPGLQAFGAVWTGSGWVVATGAGRGVFHSVQGHEPWSFVNLDLGLINSTTLAVDGHRLFGAFNILNNNDVIEQSEDDGATWQELDFLPQVFVYQLAVSGSRLFAARADGLWRRATTVSVPDHDRPVALRFALAGPQPVADIVRFRFELPEAGIAAIEVFDVAGRRAAEPIRQSQAAGPHELSWSARELGPGIYMARLTASGRQEVVRMVRVR